MNKKKKNRPTLRFPEFKGEWEETKLFNIILNISPPKKLKSSQFQENGKYPIIDQSQNDIAGYTDDEKALVKDEFPLIVFGDHTCTLKIIENPFVQGADGIKIFKGKIKVIDTRYLYHALQNEPFITKEYKRHYSILKEKIICFPKDYKEQQKIAACLSSLDDLITAHQEKLTNLKQHKKGLLQNLFPKAGEKVPRLRFNGFEGDWEEEPIKSIGEVITGGTPSKQEKEFWNGDFVWVTAQDFTSKYITNSTLKLTNKGKDKSRVIPANSILVTCIASIGLNAINRVECATNQQINAIVCNSYYYFEFIYYAITANIKQLKNLAGQTAVPIVNKSVFEQFKLQIPIPKEQQKIAACLSSLDDLISAQEQKIKQLQAHKKGLLQNLFPKRTR